MSDAHEHGPEGSDEQPSFMARVRGGFRYLEEGITGLALILLILLPLVGVLFRKLDDWAGETVWTGSSGLMSVVQHLVLVISTMGAALAAREQRLLSLATTKQFFKGWLLRVSTIFSDGFAAFVTVVLCVGCGYFAWTSRELEQEVAYGIPVWVVQCFMPLGLALIAFRLIWHADTRWWGKLCALGLGIGLASLIHWGPFEAEQLVWPLMILLLLATALGAPIFTTLAGAALILFFGEGYEFFEFSASPAIDFYEMAVNPTLPTIPLFTLAGYFLAEGGASKRLVAVFESLVGHLRGGSAVLTALVCAFFTSFTGASGVTILALGPLLLPVLLRAGYHERFSLGLLTGAGSLGLLFPPCIPLILYAIIASSAGSMVSIEAMFLGGIVPGFILVLLTACWGIFMQKKGGDFDRPRFQLRTAWNAVWTAKWELLLPVVALVSLFGGFATTVEAAAITALYALFIETVIYRDLKFGRDFLHVLKECGLLVGAILLILGVALGFNNYLIDIQVPDRALEWVEKTFQSPLTFLLALNVFLLIVGMVMDIFSAIVVVVPLIVPMGIAFGIHPVHLGIVFLANLQLGYLTPPVGMNLFLASYRFKKPLTTIYRAVLPMFFVLLTGVLLITLLPILTTWLPGLFEGSGD